ncbi:putative ribonuclease H-like domain-containing protein [Tanacetum coccineum]
MTSPNKPTSKPSRVAKMSVKPIWRKKPNLCNTSNVLNTTSPIPKPLNPHHEPSQENNHLNQALPNSYIKDTPTSPKVVSHPPLPISPINSYIAQAPPQRGKVTFRGGEGRITGKGTIRTPTLDFENVYYVKELQQFNLFSISQICDKKNRVLFTDTDCLVLSKDFMLPDESMVVLRVPRKHNLYTINLNNLSPRGNLACLVAKASVDESVKWHRRMGHVNYKNMNRLEREHS